MGKKPKIFISYAHVNLPRVHQLAEFLRMGGHDVWYDQLLVGGQSWKVQLRSQISASQCFLYALTPESVESAWCRWEFAQAVHMGKTIVTVLLQPCDLDGALAIIESGDDDLNKEFQAALRHLITYMMEDPRTISHSIDVIFIVKALERVGDHSKNIAEYVVFLVRGRDVRHVGGKKTAEEISGGS